MLLLALFINNFRRHGKIELTRTLKQTQKQTTANKSRIAHNNKVRKRNIRDFRFSAEKVISWFKKR